MLRCLLLCALPLCPVILFPTSILTVAEMVVAMNVLTPEEYTRNLYELQEQYREYLATAERNSVAVRKRVKNIETEIAKFSQGIVATDGKPTTINALLKKLSATSDANKKNLGAYRKELNEFKEANKKGLPDSRAGETHTLLYALPI